MERPRVSYIPAKVAPYNDQETDLKFFTEEHAKTPYIERERVIIKFTLPGIMRLIYSAIKRQFTRKPALFTCRSGREYDGDIEVNDSIDQVAIATECSSQVVGTDLRKCPEMIN